MDRVSTGDSLNKEDKKRIISDLNKLLTKTDAKERKCVKIALTSLSKGRLSDANKNTFMECKPKLFELVEKYEEVFNDEPNQDTIDSDLTTDEVEKLIDGKVKIYAKRSESNPMKGVTYDNGSDRYRVTTPNMKTTRATKGSAIKIAHDAQKEGLRNFIDENCVKDHFAYKSYYFVTYWEDGEPYFDILHIISTLNLEENSARLKFKEFASAAKYVCNKNEYGGYVIRTLITEEVMYELLLSSASKISKLFKKDVSAILANLRRKHKLCIDGDTLKLKKDKMVLSRIESPKAIELCNGWKLNNDPVFKYTNKEDCHILESLVSNGSRIFLTNYAHQHVLYAFIMPFEMDDERVIVKFGYSEDIVTRFGKLKTEYKCSEIYLIGIKIIHGQRTEKEFHKILTDTYKTRKEIITGLKIDKTVDKVELYQLSEGMFQKFEEVKEHNSSYLYVPESGEYDDIEKEIHNQRRMFNKGLAKRMYRHAVKEKMSDESIRYLMEQITTQQDKDLEMSRMQLETTNAQLRLKELRVEELRLSGACESLPGTDEYQKYKKPKKNKKEALVL